jgi:DNA invertase Pin-like site-specific DNA recombinase
VVGVEQWAEIRRMYFVKRLSIKEIVRRTGHSRNTIRRALRSGEPVGCVNSVPPANRDVAGDRPEFSHPTRAVAFAGRDLA